MVPTITIEYKISGNIVLLLLERSVEGTHAYLASDHGLSQMKHEIPDPQMTKRKQNVMRLSILSRAR